MEKNITIGEKYDPAMTITDPDEARAYFEVCVQHTMSFGMAREEAEEIERINFGYYAGYYSHETRLRVEQLFNCSHPYLGKAEDGRPSVEAALQAGIKAITASPVEN